MNGVLAFLQTPWGWWALGLALAALEIFAPGTYFIWLAVAAVLVGTLALFLDVGWQLQLVLFVAFAAAAILLGRKVYGRSTRPEEGWTLNERAERQVGRTAILAEPIVAGSGRAKIGDSLWRVEGPDLPAGARVTIVAIKGGVLVVEPYAAQGGPSGT